MALTRMPGPRTQVFRVDAVNPDRGAIAVAAAVLRDGGLVAFPTETVYGLGANALNRTAVMRIFEAKERPASDPLIVHVADLESARLVASVSRTAEDLAARFWPGPLTLVLKRAPGVRDAITGGQDTVAVRCPDHPLAHALLEAAQAAGIDGIVAPSANRFGRLSPTSAAHVIEELGAAVAVVLDGGSCAVGIESTIVDVSGGVPRVLRPGMITDDDIRACTGAIGTPDDDTVAPRVAGALPAHYAPRTPLELVAPEHYVARVAALRAAGEVVGLFAPPAILAACAPGAHAVAAPTAPAAYARALYATLRTLDAGECRRIVVAMPPAGAAWQGIRDRLTRAARGSQAP